MAVTLSPSSKTCRYDRCGQTFERRPGQGPKHWAEQDYCSRLCGRRARIPVTPESKTCAYDQCGQAFTRHVDTEGPAAFEARLYCRPECGYAARRGRSTAPHRRTRPNAARRPRVRATPLPVIPVVPVPGGERAVWRPNAPGWDPTGPRVA
jgi:hypothetical protein